MNDSSPTAKRSAWQPFTFGGVAAFANASWSRLLLFELLVGAIVSASVVWFVAHNYSPVIIQAIQKLPDEALLKNSKLQGVPSQLLAETKFLSIAVDLDESGQIGQTAEFQIELHESDFKICSLLRSLLGCFVCDYPEGQNILLTRSKLEPWWGAWQPVILVATGAVVLFFLFLFWAILAAFYTAPVKMAAYFADRKLSWAASWRLSSAALMPGALLMALAVALYGLQLFDLIALGFFWGAHLLVGWIYLLISPWRVSRTAAVELQKTNPFTT